MNAAWMSCSSAIRWAWWCSGFPDTTHVTLDHMLHHVAAVARAKPQALVVGDLPIHSYDTPAQALATAQQLVAAGAEAVKLEGGIRQADKVRAITGAGIPVMGHLGMLPQRVLEEGGYHKKGRTPEQAEALREGAQALVDGGSVSPSCSNRSFRRPRGFYPHPWRFPPSASAAAEHTCDGEVAVVTDLLGSFPWFVPPFAQPEADLAGATRAAVGRYISRVTNR